MFTERFHFLFIFFPHNEVQWRMLEVVELLEQVAFMCILL